ncbi:spleen tyrosine kinase [Capsaspora owczarzaki ATCC 30864]|uniref:spleen tyrosine kinase n=1 Tax=Capsaspora owczarzaki (strain ATCC 30864) TaxID=595528 RepID=UPI0001FE3790|nr:spleen tyrosine kinase [Capsaspora owczarzaki ATCC 30864]|eukprot:XP_004347345.1 spleen tyrosine kinase [Capsaspora owczarzaki ATCC 30864]
MPLRALTELLPAHSCYTQSCVDAMASIASDASVAFVSATSAASAASFAFVSATSAASAASVSIVSATSAASVSFVSATSAASVAIASAASVASAASDSATSAASISFASATSAASVSFASATSAASASFASATSAASVASVSILNLPPSSDAASAPIAAIAGAIAGVVLLLVVMALILRHRRRRQQAQAATIDRLSKSELVPIRESELSKISNVTNNTPTAVSQAPNRSTTVKAGVASPSTAESDYASVGQAFYATAGSVPSTYNYAAVGGVSTTYHYASTSEAASASKTAAAPDIKVAKNLYHAPADAVAPITYDYAVSPRIYDKPVAVTQTLRPGLVLGDKLGSGAFGVVLRGRIPRALVPADAQYLLSNPAQPDLEVAVKMLQPESGERAQQEFVEEARMVSQFDNPHIVRAIATLLEAKPHLCVLELMPHGDLRSVVHRSKQAGLRWTAGEFGHALAQVAAGLAYLESIRFVHRDIAARNCLVGVGLSVKISDFGLTRSLAEEHDYYKMEHKGRLPVKVHA